MSILFDESGIAYCKAYTKEDIELLEKKMRKEDGICDTTRLNMLLFASPADDIKYMSAFIKWDLNENISVRWFPKNWDAKSIIDFLLKKYNSGEYFFSWYDEIKPHAQKNGLHDINDFTEPYISLKT